MKIVVAAIIVTHNPDLERFEKVLHSIINGVSHIIVVDNASQNIRGLSELLSARKITLIQNRVNLGISVGLNRGLDYLFKNVVTISWVLALDQDTVLSENYCYQLLESLKSYDEIDRVWILRGNEIEWKTSKKDKFDGALININGATLSGSLIKTVVFENYKFREDFFLDFVDADLSFYVRRLNHKILMLNEPLIDHRLGQRREFLGRPINYEPGWRFREMVKNSTILILEGNIDMNIIRAVYFYFLPIVSFEGIVSTVIYLFSGWFGGFKKYLQLKERDNKNR